MIAVGDSEAQESSLETCKISPSQTSNDYFFPLRRFLNPGGMGFKKPSRVLVEEAVRLFGVDAAPSFVAAFQRNLPGTPIFVNPFYGRDCLIEPSMLENHYFDVFKKN